MIFKLKILGFFCASYILVALLFVVMANFGHRVIAAGAIAAFVAALFAGQVFYRIENRVPSRAQSWGFAAAFTACVAAISAIQFAILDIPAEIRILLRSYSFISIAAGYMAVVFASCLFFFSFAASKASKAANRGGRF